MSMWFRVVVVMCLLPAFAVANVAHAQEAGLSIQIQPQSDQPGTVVTIIGQGAPPYASVAVLVAPFDAVSGCGTVRDIETAATAMARSDGTFIATHKANRRDAEHAGNTYLAILNQGTPPRPNSNSQCFSFTTQPQARFFPETGHVVGGRFLEYWQNNGGLSVFGYPLTDEVQDDGRTVQYFERQRFEYHPGNQAPYDVLLGRMGADLLALRGIDWTQQPSSPAQAAGCIYFELTRHNVCNQQSPGIGFLNYWTTHGLQFDNQPQSSYAESLALFGLPLTEPYIYTNSSGDTVQVQWFERARFEWHADNPEGFQVLLGRLGDELIQAQGPSPQPGPPVFTDVQIYVVALGDNGGSGKLIGCGDSAVPVTVSVEPTTAPLTAAIEKLLSLDSQYYGQSGLYNALYRSDLRLDRAIVENDQATVYLSGTLQLGGVCENPRVEAQLKETARQFSTVSEVVIYLNGQRLEDVLSGQG